MGIAFFSLALGFAAQGRTPPSDRAELQALAKEGAEAPEPFTQRAPLLRGNCQSEGATNVDCADAAIRSNVGAALSAEEGLSLSGGSGGSQQGSFLADEQAKRQAASAAETAAQRAREADASLGETEAELRHQITGIENAQKLVRARCSGAEDLRRAVCSP